jgi:hypothetical protein
MIHQIVQFRGLSQEDPNFYNIIFLEIYDIFKQNRVTDDANCLRLFPFSIKGKAKAWLNSLPPSVITNWNELAQSFKESNFLLQI